MLVPTMTDVPVTFTLTSTATRTPTSTPTLTATHTATLTSTPSPTVTIVPTTTATLEIGVLFVGMQVQFTAQEVTYARIGQPTTSIVISPQRIYRVQEIAIDAENKTWYRLYDTLIELSGWIQQENLPPYRILD